MSTQMALVSGSSMPVAQAKPAAGKSAHGFGAEMQNALASAAAGTPLSQDASAAKAAADQSSAAAASDRAAAVPEGTRGGGQPEGLAGVDLLAALGMSSPADPPAAAASPATSGVQPFVQGTTADAALTGAAQTSGVPGAAGTQGSAPAGPGSSGTTPGVPALPAPVDAAAAGETESPTTALSPGSQQGTQAGSIAAGITAAAGRVSTGTDGTGAGAAVPTAAQAQQGSAAAVGAAPTAPVSDGAGSAGLQDLPSAQLFAVAGQQPAATVQGTTAQAAQAPAQAAPPAPSASQPLNTQLQGPLFSLASAKPGEHTLTLSVTPDNLGPVTVRAQIGGDGVRVELFAPNDAGRDALRAILQDLKRDLASAGLGAELDLSSQNQPAEPGEDGPDRRATAANQEGSAGRQLAGPGHHAGPYLRLGGSETGLDVLA